MYFRLDIEEPTIEIVQALIEKYDNTREQRLQDYYDGRHDILNRTFDDKSKPNNKIVTNFCKYITNVSVGNFIGVPVSYSSQDEEYMKRLQDILDYNDEQQHNASLARTASIQSRAFEILYTTVDENGDLQIRFEELDPNEQNVILVYGRSIEKNLIMAIRFFTCEDILTNETTTEIYVYTKDKIYEYVKDDSDLHFIGEEEHYFDDVPINVYWNKQEGGKGDFEDIISLNDAYNLLQSDDINESNYTNDAYLIIKNMVADKEKLDEMKQSRAIQGTDDGEVRWLIKDINDSWKENLKTRIVHDIHKTSGVPDLTDEQFAGNVSGVAMKYKLLPFENNRSQKERQFKKALQRRIKLITNILNKQGHNYDYRSVQMTFKPNLPTNEKEEIEGVVSLYGTGLVSKDTLRNKLSMVEDASLEEEKIKREQEGDIYTIQSILDEEEGDGLSEQEVLEVAEDE